MQSYEKTKLCTGILNTGDLYKLSGKELFRKNIVRLKIKGNIDENNFIRLLKISEKISENNPHITQFLLSKKQISQIQKFLIIIFKRLYEANPLNDELTQKMQKILEKKILGTEIILSNEQLSNESISESGTELAKNGATFFGKKNSSENNSCKNDPSEEKASNSWCSIM